MDNTTELVGALDPHQHVKRARPAAGYGFDVRRLLERFNAPVDRIPDILRAMELPAPSVDACVAWAVRNSIPLQWLAVVLAALQRRGVPVLLADYVTGP